MNQALTSLMNRLKRQLEELNTEQLALREKIKALDKAALLIKSRLIDSLKVPACILPELEISRLHFIICEQQKHDDLQNQKMDYEKLLFSYQENHLRLSTELKLLGKYQDRREQNEKKTHELIIEKEMDNWALQQTLRNCRPDDR
ncbi:hypothetical protein Lqui_2847 [Legionella quinlivanii]|uniref:Flagellar FliJ protein n=1 Tax=Legionella quinlivanii TaxID=45073 RepID=A0A0W0XLZ2_9GAMM|nr:hypothetical protein [Legionella quinlivanii]KTD45376.1 hypothetical protein Lqui_2847 [Legionella quinlivanii]SEG14593.1 hypothetical protein SAMN02746093_01983 [Legionella quinlivanii DSM 21216]STY10368.1 Uncharacterised protein [Legionella quinlivanii]